MLIAESEAIHGLVNYLNEDFDKSVHAILSSKGRVVVTGIGKSAIIASKIVATLNSTGTPAVFMHAADAIHGDLGMILPDDIVICLSKSGNTPEIKVLVPLLKQTGSLLVALVGDPNSYLGKEADFTLNAMVEREADPNNLAPTTSTTAALALGDALAVTLLELREFKSEDFARFHPGGSLGKKLYLKVTDLYVNHELPKVLVDASIRDVIVEITSKRLGATTVIDNNGVLLGIVTDGDLRRMLNTHTNLADLRAEHIMTRSPKTIDEEAYAVEALHFMRQNNITQLVVVNNHQQALGIVHLHDLLKEGIV